MTNAQTEARAIAWRGEYKQPGTDRWIVRYVDDGKPAGKNWRNVSPLFDATTLAAKDAELACPHCGGSGHKDDVKPAAPEGRQEAWQREADYDALIEEAKDFTERMTSQPWACELIDRLVSALTRPVEQAVTAGLLAEMSKHLNWELDWGSLDASDETSECAWRVHARSGGRNDREWTLLGAGDTPAAALTAALAQKEEGR